MSRVSKIFVWLIAGVVVVFAMAAIAFSLFFDPNDFREDIAKAVKESTGRDLVIDGEVDLQLFPWLAVELGHTTLGNAPGFGDEPFAELDRAELSVRVLPLLLRREVAIGKAEVDGLVVSLEVDRNGLRNWSDLIAPSSETDPELPPEDGGAFEISGLGISNATISYEHLQKGDQYELTEVNLSIGRVSADGDAVPARGSLRFDVQPAGMSGELEIETAVRFDRDEGLISFGSSALRGVVEGLAAQATELEFETAGIDVDSIEKTASVQPVSIKVLDLSIAADVDPFSYAGEIQPSGTIRIDEFSPRRLMELLDVSPPETADPDALSVVAIEANADFHDSYVSLKNVDIRFDDTTFAGAMTIPFESDARYLIDLSADAIDLNRYMAPSEEGEGTGDQESSPSEIPTELIKTLNVRGDLSVGSVLVGGLKLDNVVLGVNSSNGRLRIYPIRSDLFGGKYSGDVSIDASGSTSVLSMNESLQNVDLASLALAMFEQDNITGSMNGKFKLQGRGQDTDKIKQTLSGNLSFELKDGTYEGMDVWYELRRARALLRSEPAPAPVEPARTSFKSVAATGVVNDGVMRNDDFVADLAFMGLTGRGTVDIPAGTVDYDLQAQVYDSPEAREHATIEEINDFKKVEIPLEITGPLASPKVRPDVERLLRQQVEDEIKDRIGDKLKDLFKR